MRYIDGDPGAYPFLFTVCMFVCRRVRSFFGGGGQRRQQTHASRADQREQLHHLFRWPLVSPAVPERHPLGKHVFRGACILSAALIDPFRSFFGVLHYFSTLSFICCQCYVSLLLHILYAKSWRNCPAAWGSRGARDLELTVPERLPAACQPRA